VNLFELNNELEMILQIFLLGVDILKFSAATPFEIFYFSAEVKRRLLCSMSSLMQKEKVEEKY
jgi:hypothetical protein